MPRASISRTGAVATSALTAGFALGRVSDAGGILAWAATIVIVALFLFVFFRETR